MNDSLLKNRFGLEGFRVGQQEIINSVLAGRDVLAVFPTGGGKSLCYQYPAVLGQQLVVVISPLIALMNDQVETLTRMGINSAYLHSGQTQAERREVFRRIQGGGAFILYLSPERIQQEALQAWLKTRSIALFAVDEAHCVSQWGHDFRAEYSQLRILKRIRPDVPVLALTASATPLVLADIAEQLMLKDPARHVHGFYRPNLYYQVEACANDETKLQLLRVALERFSEGRVIVYCGTRKMTEELAFQLRDRYPTVSYYHAGLAADKRKETQEAFARKRSRILIATNAFGMGVDYSDIRLVVHFQMPANIDSLYQEMGRAGRDGLNSTCLMIFAQRDKGLQSYFIQRSQAPARIQNARWRALENLLEYAEGGECRHAEILTYYQDSQRISRCGHCDVCAPNSERRIQIPVSGFQTLLRKVMRKSTPSASITLTPEQQRDFEALRLWRRAKALELDVPAFVVLSDRSLRHLVQVRPRRAPQFQHVYGFGAVKIERFAQELLNGPLASLEWTER